MVLTACNLPSSTHRFTVEELTLSMSDTCWVLRREDSVMKVPINGDEYPSSQIIISKLDEKVPARLKKSVEEEVCPEASGWCQPFW